MTGDDTPEMSWSDWVKSFYLSLMKQGYKLNEIDEMDIYYYWQLLNHENEQREMENTKLADEMGI